MQKSIIKLSFLVATFLFSYKPVLSQQNQTRQNSLLYWAEKLQQNISNQNTEYRHKDNIVSWGDDGNNLQCYADCSGFINALVSKTFEWDEDAFKKNFGHKRMYAYHYYEAITSNNHFQQLKNIRELQPGNIIAVQYANRDEHDDNTGHVMLIASFPQIHKSSKLILPNTLQYVLQVIDCSKSPHGKNDTRKLNDGNEYSGLGKGLFRLYTDLQGNIVAYSWSDGNPKEDYNPYENPVVVGKFIN